MIQEYIQEYLDLLKLYNIPIKKLDVVERLSFGNIEVFVHSLISFPKKKAKLVTNSQNTNFHILDEENRRLRLVEFYKITTRTTYNNKEIYVSLKSLSGNILLTMSYKTDKAVFSKKCLFKDLTAAIILFDYMNRNLEFGIFWDYFEQNILE